MKKVILTIALTLTMAQAGEIYQSVNIGANQSKIDNETGNGFDVSWNGTKVWDNGVLGGVALNYGQVKIEDETFSNYGGDIKVGYKYKDIAIFGLGSGIYQSYYDESSAGFGYGGGVEYTPFKHFGVGAEYKTYNMTSESVDYDFETSRIYLSIIF